MNSTALMLKRMALPVALAQALTQGAAEKRENDAMAHLRGPQGALGVHPGVGDGGDSYEHELAQPPVPPLQLLLRLLVAVPSPAPLCLLVAQRAPKAVACSDDIVQEKSSFPDVEKN